MGPSLPQVEPQFIAIAHNEVVHPVIIGNAITNSFSLPAETRELGPTGASIGWIVQWMDYKQKCRREGGQILLPLTPSLLLT